MAENEDSCLVCRRLKEAIESGDRTMRDFAQTVYILHLRDFHQVSEFEILKRTGVYVQ